MLKKAIVLEIKDAYVLAMEEGGAIVRLTRRDPLAEGDVVYFLPEDLFQAERLASITPLPIGKTRRSSRGVWMRLGSLAAVLLLFVLAFFPHGQATAYALVSLNGANSVELELSREGKILHAVSDSDAVSEEMLRALLGSSLGDSAEALRQLCGGRPLFAAYALLGGEEDEQLESLLLELFGNELICRRGTPEDLARSREQQTPLVRYLFEDEEELRRAWEASDDDRDDDEDDPDNELDEDDRDERRDDDSDRDEDNKDESGRDEDDQDDEDESGRDEDDQDDERSEEHDGDDHDQDSDDDHAWDADTQDDDSDDEDDD